MNVLVYADLHVAEGHDVCRHDLSLSLQRYRVRLFFKQMQSVIKQYRCAGVWDLGDTTDDRTSIPIPSIRDVVDGLSIFPESRLNIKLIGNHEQYHKDARTNVGCLYTPKFDVVNDIEAYDVGNGTAVLACAYPNDLSTAAQRYNDSIRELKKIAKRVIVLGHFDVIGARYRSGPVMSGIPVSALDGADLVLLGHVHKPQSVTETVHYIGSPFQQDFGEAGEAKRVLVLNTDTLACTWIPMSEFPEYKTISYDQFKALNFDSTDENQYRVVLKSVDESSNFYASRGANQCAPVYDYDQQSSPGSQNETVMDRADADTCIKKWMQLHPVSAAGLTDNDTDAVFKSGIELIKQH